MNNADQLPKLNELTEDQQERVKQLKSHTKPDEKGVLHSYVKEEQAILIVLASELNDSPERKVARDLLFDKEWREYISGYCFNKTNDQPNSLVNEIIGRILEKNKLRDFSGESDFKTWSFKFIRFVAKDINNKGFENKVGKAVNDYHELKKRNEHCGDVKILTYPKGLAQNISDGHGDPPIAVTVIPSKDLAKKKPRNIKSYLSPFSAVKHSNESEESEFDFFNPNELTPEQEKELEQEMKIMLKAMKDTLRDVMTGKNPSFDQVDKEIIECYISHSEDIYDKTCTYYDLADECKLFPVLKGDSTQIIKKKREQRYQKFRTVVMKFKKFSMKKFKLIKVGKPPAMPG